MRLWLLMYIPGKQHADEGPLCELRQRKPGHEFREPVSSYSLRVSIDMTRDLTTRTQRRRDEGRRKDTGHAGKDDRSPSYTVPTTLPPSSHALIG